MKDRLINRKVEVASARAFFGDEVGRNKLRRIMPWRTKVTSSYRDGVREYTFKSPKGEKIILSLDRDSSKVNIHPASHIVVTGGVVYESTRFSKTLTIVDPLDATDGPPKMSGVRLRRGMLRRQVTIETFAMSFDGKNQQDLSRAVKAANLSKIFAGLS